MVPVLYDTVVAVAVVVEIDLEVKESVVHYCSVVVIKSFGAIINVLVTFPIFIIWSLEKNFSFSREAFPDVQVRPKHRGDSMIPSFRMGLASNFRPTK